MADSLPDSPPMDLHFSCRSSSVTSHETNFSFQGKASCQTIEESSHKAEGGNPYFQSTER